MLSWRGLRTTKQIIRNVTKILENEFTLWDRLRTNRARSMIKAENIEAVNQMFQIIQFAIFAACSFLVKW